MNFKRLQLIEQWKNNLLNAVEEIEHRRRVLLATRGEKDEHRAISVIEENAIAIPLQSSDQGPQVPTKTEDGTYMDDCKEISGML